jgi:predicted metal-dependent HD superfamily phosphohydrolase
MLADLQEEVQQYVYEYLSTHLPSSFVFHDYTHAEEVAEVAEELAEAAELSEQDKATLFLAAWFHDTGYCEGKDEHEVQSVEIFKQFAAHRIDPLINREAVQQLILSTKHNIQPESRLEKLLHDANYAYLGRKRFARRGRLLRLEEEAIQGKKFSLYDWQQHMLELQLETKFYTPEGHTAFAKRKNKNIASQREDIVKARKTTVRKKTGKDFGRGVDTIYRVTLRNHINLSSIADGKANMIISINTLVLSILITAGSAGFSLSTSIQENLGYIIPVLILMLTSLVAITFAVFSAIPKVSGQDFTEEDVKQHKVSLLYFGNFLKLEKREFVGYLRDLKEDQEVLYDDLSRDLYNLGMVLRKKYRLLTYAYRTFVGGLVLSFLVFIGSLLLMNG